MISKNTASFQVLFIVSLHSVLGTSLLWRSYGSVHLFKSLIRQVLWFTSGGLGLVILVLGGTLNSTISYHTILVLVVRIWPCLHHWL